MIRRSSIAAATLAAALLAGAASASQPTLSAHVPLLVASHQAVRIGAPDPRIVLHLAITLPMRNEAALDALLRDIYDPASANFRHYLSVAEFADRFGPLPQDYRAAAAYFAAQGMAVTADAPNRFLLQADATVAQAERTFHVQIGLYRDPAGSRVFFAPDREPTLDIATPILHITGLDNAMPPRPRLLPPSAAAAAPRLTGSGPHGYFIGTDIRAAYYPSGTLTGAGQSLGLMELGPYDPSGPANFFANFGPKNRVQLSNIAVDGSPVTCHKCNDGEQDLDIEYAISMAPGLQQVQVYVGRNADAVLNRMATDNTSQQLSTSWGWNENFAVDDKLLKEMAVQGQSMLTASGDFSSLKASGPWPEEDANITAVGGTNLYTQGAGGPWKTETGWKDSAGGPSLDTRIDIESYQSPFITAANGGSTKLRNVPDIGAIAGFQFELCDSKSCVGGYGGTSFASPIWTGFVALANQQAAAAGKPRVGFLNPALYRLAGAAGYKTEFHDTLKGVSGKFRCTPSFDLVTGLGSPHGQALIDALSGG